jgi:oxygen-dependent protoporphyrinogen oxidase
LPARVVVVGGGISGLAAALELLDAGLDVTLLEASERLGGPIFTERRDGFIIDAGPDSFLSSKPGGLALAARLALSSRIVNTSQDGGGTFIVHEGRMEPLPEGITMLVPTQFRQILKSPLLDARGKARLLADYLVPARRGDRDEPVASFMRRRVGRQAFERLAEPLLSGIYAGDATRLSILSTFPRLREAERRHGGLIRAGLAARRRATQVPDSPHTPFVSFDLGLGTLVDAAAEALDAADVRTRASVTGIAPRASGFEVSIEDGTQIEADALVIATPAYAAAAMLGAVSAELAAELREIPYVSSATASMAYRERDVARRSSGRGFVVPRVEGFDLTAVTWSSRKFAGRAPEGRVLLRGFVGRAGNEEPAFLPDERVIEIVRRDLAAITGLTAEPLFARVYRWQNAMPQYHVGHRERLWRIEAALANLPRLALVGAAYHGVGIPDCITSAIEASRTLLAAIDSGDHRA